MAAVFTAGSGQETFTCASCFPKCQGIRSGGTKTKPDGGKIEVCNELP